MIVIAESWIIQTCYFKITHQFFPQEKLLKNHLRWMAPGKISPKTLLGFACSLGCLERVEKVWSYGPIWVFPNMMVSPNHPFSWVFHYKPSILGYPYFWKRPYVALIMIYPGTIRSKKSPPKTNPRWWIFYQWKGRYYKLDLCLRWLGKKQELYLPPGK